MAARLGRLIFHIADPVTGAAVSGASIEIRRQGATVVSGGPTTFTVDNPGAIRHSGEVGAPSTDSLTAYKPDGTVRDSSVRAVTVLTASSITVGSPGFTGVVDDDRLSPTTNLPTVYNDAEGDESIPSSLLSTDSNGFAACFAPIAPYDALVSGAGLTDRLLIDVVAVGVGSFLSNAFGTAAQTHFRLDTLRDMLAGDKHLVGLERGTEIWSFNDVGKLTCVGISSSAGVTISAGGLIVSAGGAAITGNSTIVGTLSSLTGITMTSGDFDTTGGTSAVRASRLKANRGTLVVAGDFVLGAGWGTGASVSAVTGGSTDSRGVITITSGSASFSADPSVTFTFKDGTYSTGTNIIPMAYVTRQSGTLAGFICFLNTTGLTSVVWQVIGLTPTASQTFQLVWHTIG